MVSCCDPFGSGQGRRDHPHQKDIRGHDSDLPTGKRGNKSMGMLGGAAMAVPKGRNRRARRRCAADERQVARSWPLMRRRRLEVPDRVRWKR